MVRVQVAMGIVGVLAAAEVSESAFSITSADSTLIDNFNSYTGNGFSPSPVAGQLNSDYWAVRGASDGNLDFGGTTPTSGNNSDFARGTSAGSTGTPGLFAFTVGSGDAIFGVQQGVDDFGRQNGGQFYLKLQNNTGQAWTGFQVGYEIWYRNDQDRTTNWNFAWGVNATSFTNPTAVSYTTVPSLAFEGLGAIDDPVTWKLLADQSATITADVPAGQYIYLRFDVREAGESGGRDETGLDDITFRAIIPEPTSMAALGALASMALGRRLRRRC